MRASITPTAVEEEDNVDDEEDDREKIILNSIGIQGFTQQPVMPQQPLPFDVVQRPIRGLPISSRSAPVVNVPQRATLPVVFNGPPTANAELYEQYLLTMRVQ